MAEPNIIVVCKYDKSKLTTDGELVLLNVEPEDIDDKPDDTEYQTTIKKFVELYDKKARDMAESAEDVIREEHKAADLLIADLEKHPSTQIILDIIKNARDLRYSDFNDDDSDDGLYDGKDELVQDLMLAGLHEMAEDTKRGKYDTKSAKKQKIEEEEKKE